MIIRGLLTALTLGGFMLWVTTKIPQMSVFSLWLGLDYIGCFMMVVPLIIIFIQLDRTKTQKQFDPSSGKANINFIRRDSNVVPLEGTRVYAGESFLEVLKLGLIEDFGKDCVLNWGCRRTRLGLENINYTPDPRYFNLTAELYRMGFDSSDDLWNVLNVSLLQDETMKAYYLEYMARVYMYLLHPPLRGAKKLVQELKTTKPKEKKVFVAAPKSDDKTVHDSVVKELKERFYGDKKY